MKRRVLHVINSLTRAGAERQLVLNLSALDKDRFENYVCYLFPDHALADEARDSSAKVFCLEMRGKKDWPADIWRLARFIKARHIDIVHTSLFDADIIGGIAARLAGVPAVSTLTNPDDSVGVEPFREELGIRGFKLLMAEWLHRAVYRHCHRHFIAVSEYVKESWSRHEGIKESRITVIYRAVVRDLLKPEDPDGVLRAREALSLGDSYPVILNVGRLRLQKGQRYIVDAMPRILESYPGAKLLIAGEGPLREQLESRCRDLRLDGAVNFLGIRSDVKVLYLLSDIFVFPSLFEGFGGALLEAAALGKPCVVMDMGPMKEILTDGESGLFIPLHDAAALAKAVIRLSEDREMARALGMKARETVLRRHIIENLVPALEDLYVRVINSRKAH